MHVEVGLEDELRAVVAGLLFTGCGDFLEHVEHLVVLGVDDVHPEGDLSQVRLVREDRLMSGDYDAEVDLGFDGVLPLVLQVDLVADELVGLRVQHHHGDVEDCRELGAFSHGLLDLMDL